MTREDRMNAIFDSTDSEEDKIIRYQQIVMEHLNEQLGEANRLLLAALNKKIEAL